MAVDLSPPRSHVDTPAWQSFEMRMRARAAEHRAAKRRRRIRYVSAVLGAALIGAGSVVAVHEGPVVFSAWLAFNWPEPPVAPLLTVPAMSAPLPLPTNWDVVVEQQMVEPEVIEQSVVARRREEVTPRSEPTDPPPVATAPRAPRTIEWSPPARAQEEAPITPMESVPLAEPPPAAVSGLPGSTTTTPAAPASVPRTDPRESVRGVIERYRNAYERLDASAARAVWPRVDTGALTRAFNSLASQELSFDSCAITVSGANADANCSGRSTVVPKIGGGSASARRTWQFKLREAGDGWVIDRATVR